MMLLNKLKNTELFCFNNIKMLPIFLLTIILINGFQQKTITNLNKSVSSYEIMFTYYHPGDATGSGAKTGSGKTTSDFTVDSNGWYHYEQNGTDYLVIAAATTYCRDAANHCGVDVQKHGLAKKIKYYQYYDTLVLNLGGTTYNAIVLDSCGACMWEKQDNLGEKFDIFASSSNAVNPGIYNSSSSIVGSSGNVSIGSYTTTYSGDLEKGYIYKTQYNKALKTTQADNIEERIMSIISNIFGKANSYYNATGSIDSNYEIISDNNDTKNWKQYDSAWGSIPLGNSNETIKSAGCLATSVAIQIKNSGTQLNTTNFNPGTFVRHLNNNGGFSGPLFVWGGAWKGLAPNFEFVSKVPLPATKQGKIEKVKQILSQGYYPVMCVKRNCGHWVAVTGVSNDNIMISDPGGNYTTVWPKYNNISSDGSLKIAYFKKND